MQFQRDPQTLNAIEKAALGSQGGSTSVEIRRAFISRIEETFRQIIDCGADDPRRFVIDDRRESLNGVLEHLTRLANARDAQDEQRSIASKPWYVRDRVTQNLKHLSWDEDFSA